MKIMDIVSKTKYDVVIGFVVSEKLWLSLIVMILKT